MFGAAHIGEAAHMFDETMDVVAVSAASARAHVTELEAERALAEATGVAEIDSYLEDLEWELDAWRDLYVKSAVTEIAVLRAQLEGPLTDD